MMCHKDFPDYVILRARKKSLTPPRTLHKKDFEQSLSQNHNTMQISPVRTTI